MKNISSHVEDFMHGYPFLSKFLRQGIVNYKALARSIQPEISQRIGEKVSVGAIAVSLQRLHTRDKDKIYSLIGRLRGVRVISNVTACTFQDQAQVYQVMSSLYTDSGLQQPFVVVMPTEEGALLFAERIAGEKFEHMTTLNKAEKLTALVITREITEDTEVGGLSYPLQVLAEYGILVRATSATFNEETIIVNEDSADQAASILRHAMWR